jgi:hypothetical protein
MPIYITKKQIRQGLGLVEKPFDKKGVLGYNGTSL